MKSSKKMHYFLLISFNPLGFKESPREEGKRGTGGVFVTPSKVELPKMVHAYRATPSVEYASLNLFARRTVFGSGTGKKNPLVGVART